MTVNPLTKLYIETLKSSLLNELYIENETRIVQMLARKLNNVDSTFEDIYFPVPALQATIYERKQDVSDRFEQRKCGRDVFKCAGAAELHGAGTHYDRT